MRLITEKGQLVLPEDFKFEIKVNSPVFSKSGAQSLPVTLPDRANDLYLDYPTRPGQKQKYIRKIPAKLESGIIHKSGQLVIDSSKRDSGITGAIMINESDFYSQIKEMTLTDVFSKIIRDDFAASEDKIEAWYNHIYSCMVGQTIDDFTAFPVGVNINDEKYDLINSPDVSSSTAIWALQWRARRVASGSDAVNVPPGYGVTPFLWLWRMVELLFNHFDYTVRENPFKTDLFLRKIVLINNTADSICKGNLNYADLVPTCSISDFVNWLEDKFLIHVYVYAEEKIVDLIHLQDVLQSATQLDLTNKLNGSIKQIYSESEEVNMSSDTSIEGASPAAETIFDFAQKFDQVTSLNENDFQNNAWEYNIVLRKSTGEYYQILRKPGISEIKKNRLGTNYFRYFTSRVKERKYEAKDVMPVMVEINLGISGSKQRIMICPYIGTSKHKNTSYKDQKTDTEQKIIIALAAGPSDENNVIEAKYILGTTQKFNNLGTQWSLFDLTTNDLYALYFKKWDSVLSNCGVTIEAKIDFSPEELLSLRLDAPFLLSGQPVLLKNISYAVGRKIENGVSEFALIKELDPLLPEMTATFTEQLYRWNYESNAGEIFSPFDTQEWDSYTWEYVGPSVPTSQAFEYIPAPTLAQYLSGEVFYYQESPIKIYAKRTGESTIIVFDRTLTAGFRAVLIG